MSDHLAAEWRRAYSPNSVEAPFESVCVAQSVQDVEELSQVVATRAMATQIRQSDLGVSRLNKAAIRAVNIIAIATATTTNRFKIWIFRLSCCS